MAFFDTRFIQKAMEDLGRTCTITEVSISTGSDAYRTVTETETDHDNIKCHIQILSEADDQVKSGIAKAGDLIFWFDYAQESYCVQGNRITYDSKTYQMEDVHKFEMEGTTYLIQCRTRKI